MSEKETEALRQHLTETVWLVAEAFGADRSCTACCKVVRKLDQRELGYRCMQHGASDGR